MISQLLQKWTSVVFPPWSSFVFRFPPNSVDTCRLHKYTITNVLILAQVQNQVIFVKYTSSVIVLLKYNVVKAIFTH